MKKLLLFMALAASSYAAAYKEICIHVTNTVGTKKVTDLNFVGGQPPEYWHLEHTLENVYKGDCLKAPCPQAKKNRYYNRRVLGDKKCFIILDEQEKNALLDILKKFSDNTPLYKTPLNKQIKRGPLNSPKEPPIERARDAIRRAEIDDLDGKPFGTGKATVGQLRKKIQNPSRWEN